jgi:hypothetical protein
MNLKILFIIQVEAKVAKLFVRSFANRKVKHYQF